MAKAILIILSLAGFASGAEWEAADKLTVDSSTILKSTVTILSQSSQTYILGLQKPSGEFAVQVATTGNMAVGTTTVSGARLAVIGSTETAYALAVGTGTNYSFSISSSGTAQFSGPVYKGTNTVLDSSFLDDFTLKFSSMTDRLEAADRMEQNTMLLAFKMAAGVPAGLSKFNMVDGIMDDFQDQTGVDTVNSSNQSYDGTNHLYSPATMYDSYTRLLLHFDGANGSTAFADETGKTIVQSGNAQISTAQKKFGVSSGYFDGGAASHLLLPSGDDFKMLSSESYTIDFWVYHQADSRTYLYQTMKNQNDLTPSIAIGANSSETFITLGDGTAFVFAQPGVGVPSNLWHHIAYVVDRSSQLLRFFLDGTQIASADITGLGTGALTPQPIIGGRYDNNTAYKLQGYMDEFRISKGIARWTTNFTPPGSAYAPSGCGNMTLISTTTFAEAPPAQARLVLFEENGDTITLNADLKAYVSRCGNSSWSALTLLNEGNYETGNRILSGIVDLTAQVTGTSMLWKVTTHNNRNLKLHGVGMTWD